jgi:cytochrome c556
MKRILLALLTLAAFSGATAETLDRRTPVTVSDTTRQMVLDEMRGFVEALGVIAGALAREDMAAVAAAAEPHGMRAMKKFPKPNMMEMPESFRAIGRTVHQDFDRLAADARGGGDVRQALVTVSQALAKCSGCHTAYRLQVRD